MKVVLDTNVLLAAFATRGLCEAVLQVCLGAHEIIISEHILEELHKYLNKKIHLPPQQAEEAMVFLRNHTTIVVPTKLPTDVCRDRSDLPVLGTAIAAMADCVVSGDRDLLDLQQFRGIPILSPRAFYDRLR